MQASPMPTQGRAGLSHPPRRVEMPARVRLAIAEQQDRSERLIGWLQLAILLFFALLYAISPKTAAARPGLSPVWLTLGLYFIFTLVRLGLAYRTRLPGWFLVLSSVIDIVLLYGLIVSFHTQYGQPVAAANPVIST